MNFKPNTTLEATGITPKHKRESFSLVVLENSPEFLIVRDSHGVEKMIYNKQSKSLRNDRCGEKKHNHVQFLITNN
jgi:hypothetical protein